MDGAPYMLELSYVDYDCCPGIENISFHEESLYAELKRFGVQMAEGHETIGITYATEEESQYLQVDEETYLSTLPAPVWIRMEKSLSFPNPLPGRTRCVLPTHCTDEQILNRKEVTNYETCSCWKQLH